MSTVLVVPVRALWALHTGLWRWPKTAAVLAAAVVAWTPVTLGHLAAGVTTYAAALGLISLDATARVRAVSVQRWPRFRQRRRCVRRRWVAVMASAGMVSPAVYPGGPKRRPRIVRVRDTGLGVRVSVNGAPVAVGAEHMRAKADRLRHGFGCRDVRAQDVGGRIVLDLLWEDPFANIVRARGLVKSNQASSGLHVPVGVDEHGRPVHKSLALPSLVVGAPGSGKSTEVWATLYALQHSGIPHRVRVCDPKGGVELGALQDAAWSYVSSPADWPGFLEHTCGALQVRLGVLRSRGLRSCPFDQDNPLDLLIVDELLTVLAVSRQKIKAFGRTMPARDAFLVYLSQCRAAGFTTICLSQLAEKEVLGAIRGLFSHVSVLRVGPTETALVDVLLGTGASKAYPAQELRPGPTTAGVGWVRSASGITKYRGASLSEAERRQVVRRMAADTARMRHR